MKYAGRCRNASNVQGHRNLEAADDQGQRVAHAGPWVRLGVQAAPVDEEGDVQDIRRDAWGPQGSSVRGGSPQNL